MTDGHDHRRPAWLATLCALLVIATFLAAKAARDATLLAQFSIQTLPLFIGLSAALALPVILIAGKLMARYGPHRLVPAMNAASALLGVVEWMMIHDFPRATAVLVFFHLNTASAVLVSGFWSLINERFDVATAKRHIGRIGMGATFGGILGGLVAERTGAYFAPETILLVLAVMQAMCAVLLWRLGRGGRLAEVEPSASNWAALRTVARSQLLRRAGLVVIVTAIGASALDYVFKADIVAGGSKTDLLRALAVFYTATNIVTAIVQIVLCAPVISTFGVPRSVATLPITLTGFSLLALLLRVPVVATVARGAEFVIRNSIYRAGYELLYAPLPPEQKRPTKVVLDVGADKLGDIVAAQLIGAVILLAVDDRTALLLLAVIAGAVSVIVSIGIPRSYTSSLEAGLLEKANVLAATHDEVETDAWVSMSAMPAVGHPEAMQLRMRRRRRKPVPAQPKPSTDALVAILRDLRSDTPARIVAALSRPLPAEAIAIAIELVGSDNDEVAHAAEAALQPVASRSTGALIDVLLDPTRPERHRRRMPALIASGQPELAVSGLWHGLGDPSFDVRYRCSVALSMISRDTPIPSLHAEEVYEHVRKELACQDEWRTRKLTVDGVSDPGEPEIDVGLDYVFRVLGLVLPAEPLRVALRAAKTDNDELRGIALEYLESILPPDVRAQLWPLLDAATPVSAVAVADHERQTELLQRLRSTNPEGFQRPAGVVRRSS